MLSSRITAEYAGIFTSKTIEKIFEDDIMALLRKVGWRTFASNAQVQVDYDCRLALKIDSLVGFAGETQSEE